MTTMSGETLHRKELLEEPHRHIGTYRYSGQWSVGYDKYLSKSRLFHTPPPPPLCNELEEGGGAMIS